MQKIIKEIYDMFDFNKFDVHIKNIMLKGICVSFVVLLFSVLFLSLYIEFKYPSSLYFIGSQLFKSTSMFITYFLICGITFNKISSQIKL